MQKLGKSENQPYIESLVISKPPDNKIPLNIPQNLSIADLRRITFLTILDMLLKFLFAVYKSQHPVTSNRHLRTCRMITRVSNILFFSSKMMSIIIMIYGLRSSIKKSYPELKRFRNCFHTYVVFEFIILFYFIIEILAFDCQGIKAHRLGIVSFVYLIGGVVGLGAYYFVWEMFLKRALMYLNVGGWGQDCDISIATPKSYNTFEKLEEERQRFQVNVRRRKRIEEDEREYDGEGEDKNSLLVSEVIDEVKNE